MHLLKKDFINNEFFQKAQVILLSLFAFSIPLLPKISTIILIVLVVCSIIHKGRNNVKNFAFLIFPILYLITIISVFYSKNYNLSYLEQRASFIAFPLIFLTLKMNNNDYVRVLKSFVFGCVIALVICFLNAFYNSFSIVNDSIVFQPVVNSEFSFFYAVVRDGNYFFSKFFSIFHQTTYFSIYLNTAIAIILSLSLWREHKSYILFLFLFLTGIFQISSKAGIFTAIIIFLFFTFIKIRNVGLRFLSYGFIISIGLLIATQNPRGKVMIDNILNSGLSFNKNDRDGFALRLMSWDAAVDVLKEHFLIGMGISDVQDELDKKYVDKKYKTPHKEHFNAHNQYLQFYLEYGLIGLIAILLILYFVVNKSKDEKLNLSIFLILVFNFLFESFMNRYSGISFVLLFYYLINYKKHYLKEV